MSPGLADAIRIDAGRPAFGVDMTEETIPLEAGLLERAISQTKGCYVGQEVIIRVLHRGGGRVAKRLVRIACDHEGGEVPAVGATVSADDREVGRVTSSARSPRTGRNNALAYVHRDAAEVGRRLTLKWQAGQAGGVIEAFAG
jgi:tRNA-modifying protein YgfZ